MPGPELTPPMQFTAPGAALVGPDACRFRVWAPYMQRVRVHLLGQAESEHGRINNPPYERVRFVRLKATGDGFHEAVVEGVAAGQLYRYRLDGGVERPDPASHFQPDGVHGPSQVIDPAFDWHDAQWRGLPLAHYVLYELHVGTYTPQGTLAAAIEHLPRLRDLGVTAIELMPLTQFPGARNWGYDGVYPFAVQNSYGGPRQLKFFVDACHAHGLAVALDVVYNHLGPEGNYLADFGPYFTTRYHTPWGPALNFDGHLHKAVRDYFWHNAAHWIREFHVDALRLDAVHAIFDRAPQSFLGHLGELVARLGVECGRQTYCIAESNQNDPQLTRPRAAGGYGIDAQWNDDFHRSLHALLTGERGGYFVDYGGVSHLAQAIGEGFVLRGQHSRYRGGPHGAAADDLDVGRLVVFSQNHDQTGNRRLGERLTTLVGFEQLKLAAALMILSPCIPLLFMGEEYGEVAPFQYFVSHSEEYLIESVRRGRKRDFSAFDWQDDPPDPQAPQTFLRSKLQHGLAGEPRHATLFSFYRRLLELRRSVPALADLDREKVTTESDDMRRTLLVRRQEEDSDVLLAANFAGQPRVVDLPADAELWHLLLDSADADWEGPGGLHSDDLAGGAELTLQPWSVAVLEAGV